MEHAGGTIRANFSYEICDECRKEKSRHWARTGLDWFCQETRGRLRTVSNLVEALWERSLLSFLRSHAFSDRFRGCDEFAQQLAILDPGRFLDSGRDVDSVRLHGLDGLSHISRIEPTG